MGMAKKINPETFDQIAKYINFGVIDVKFVNLSIHGIKSEKYSKLIILIFSVFLSVYNV